MTVERLIERLYMVVGCERWYVLVGCERWYVSVGCERWDVVGDVSGCM